MIYSVIRDGAPPHRPNDGGLGEFTTPLPPKTPNPTEREGKGPEKAPSLPEPILTNNYRAFGAKDFSAWWMTWQGKNVEWGSSPAYEQQIIVGREGGSQRDRESGINHIHSNRLYTFACPGIERH